MVFPLLEEESQVVWVMEEDTLEDQVILMQICMVAELVLVVAEDTISLVVGDWLILELMDLQEEALGDMVMDQVALNYLLLVRDQPPEHLGAEMEWLVALDRLVVEPWEELTEMDLGFNLTKRAIIPPFEVQM